MATQEYRELPDQVAEYRELRDQVVEYLELPDQVVEYLELPGPTQMEPPECLELKSRLEPQEQLPVTSSKPEAQGNTTGKRDVSCVRHDCTCNMAQRTNPHNRTSKAECRTCAVHIVLVSPWASTRPC